MNTSYLDSPARLSGDGDIICPGCGECYLHLAQVSVLFRHGEDGPAERITVERATSGHRITTASDSNAPGRRDSVVIRAFCEHCDDWGKKGNRALIELVEHKGFLVMSVRRESP